MLNLHQAFQLPAGYDKDTVTVDLRLRLMGMSKVCLQVMGMDLQQNFLRTDSMVVPGGTGWQAVRCSLPLKDVRYLTVGIVGCSKMKALLDFLPSKVYLDRMSIRVGGHSRESAIREIMQDVAGHLFDIHELESFVEEGKADR